MQQQQRTASESLHRRWVNKAENGIILFRFAFVLCCCCCTRARGVKSTATQQRRGNGKLCFSQIEFCWVLSLWWEEESRAVKISSVNKSKHCVRRRWKSSWTFPHEMIPMDAVLLLGWAESERQKTLVNFVWKRQKRSNNKKWEKKKVPISFNIAYLTLTHNKDWSFLVDEENAEVKSHIHMYTNPSRQATMSTLPYSSDIYPYLRLSVFQLA